jgi:hypothetical protein
MAKWPTGVQFSAALGKKTAEFDGLECNYM